MSDLLPLEESAVIIGLPAEQLRIWAYDRTGPQNSGTINRPMYRAEHLKQWAQTQGQALARQVG